MTDTAPPLDLADDPAFDPERPHVCPECSEPFKTPANLGTHRSRKHGVPGTKGHRANAGQSAASARATSINVNLGSKSKTTAAKVDPAIEAVRQRAEMLAGMVAVGLFMFGQQEDAGDIEKGKARWAEAVGELAVYEEWLRKLAQGGESSERMLAWLKFLGATFGLALPILIRHEAIPPALMRLFTMATPEGAQPMPPPAPPQQEPAGESVAA